MQTHLKVLVASLLLAAAPRAFGDLLVAKHSSLRHNVALGDRLELKAESTDSRVGMRWILDQRIVAMGPLCQLSIQDWGLGEHKIILEAYDLDSISQIEFRIKVTSPAFGKRPQTHSPPLIPTSKVTKWSQRDLMIQSIKGPSYFGVHRNAVALTKLPKLHHWHDAIWNEDGGWLRLGQRERFEIWLGDRSQASLHSNEHGRYVLLKSGVLRQRSWPDQDGALPLIKLGEWLSLDPEFGSDVIVAVKERSQKQLVEVNLIQGKVKIRYQNLQIQAEEVQWQELILEAGQKLRLHQGSTPLMDEVVSFAFVAKILKNTSPHLFSRSDFVQWQKRAQRQISHNSQSPILRLPLRYLPWLALADADDTLTTPVAIRAQSNFNKGQYLAAIEDFYRLSEREMKVKPHEFMLAQSLHTIGLLTAAESHYKQAVYLDFDNADVHFKLGELYFSRSEWDFALEHFVKAKRRGYRFTQKNLFYIGVCEFHLDSRNYARNSFKEALIQSEPDAAIQAKIEDFLKTIEQEKTWYFGFDAAAIYDSNIMRLPDPDQGAPAIPQGSGAGIEAQASLRAKAFEDTDGRIFAFNNIEQRIYISDNLERLNRQMIEGGLDLGFSLRPPEGDSLVTMRFSPILKSISYGNAQSALVYAAAADLRIDIVSWQPTLRLITELWNDPDPERYDVIDPDLEIFSYAIDRSKYVQELQFSVRPLLNSKQDLKLGWGSRRGSHFTEITQSEDYHRQLFVASYDHRLDPQVNVQAQLRYQSFDFDTWLGGRRDLRIDSQLAASYFFNDNIFLSARFLWEHQDSNIEWGRYQRWISSAHLHIQL